LPLYFAAAAAIYELFSTGETIEWHQRHGGLCRGGGRPVHPRPAIAAGPRLCRGRGWRAALPIALGDCKAMTLSMPGVGTRHAVATVRIFNRTGGTLLSSPASPRR
jgi:hypothetical protein